MAITPAQLSERGFPVWKQIVISGLYTGLSPIASGTVGSAVAALFYFIPGFSNFYILIAASLVAFLVGIPLASQVEKATGRGDPSFVTLDEFAGQWLTLASPIVFPNVYWVVLCFLVFRAFDIAKIWPASYFEHRSGGLGVMGDDMMAAIYANIASHLIWYGAVLLAPFVGFLKDIVLPA
jgi:phosphatidylglycerophosphatase A